METFCLQPRIPTSLSLSLSNVRLWLLYLFSFVAGGSFSYFSDDGWIRHWPMNIDEYLRLLGTQAGVSKTSTCIFFYFLFCPKTAALVGNGFYVCLRMTLRFMSKGTEVFLNVVGDFLNPMQDFVLKCWPMACGFLIMFILCYTCTNLQFNCECLVKYGMFLSCISREDRQWLIKEASQWGWRLHFAMQTSSWLSVTTGLSQGTCSKGHIVIWVSAVG